MKCFRQFKKKRDKKPENKKNELIISYNEKIAKNKKRQ